MKTLEIKFYIGDPHTYISNITSSCLTRYRYATTEPRTGGILIILCNEFELHYIIMCCILYNAPYSRSKLSGIISNKCKIIVIKEKNITAKRFH